MQGRVANPLIGAEHVSVLTGGVRQFGRRGVSRSVCRKCTALAETAKRSPASLPMRGLLLCALLNLELFLRPSLIDLCLHPFGRAALAGPGVFGSLRVAVLDLGVTF